MRISLSTNAFINVVHAKLCIKGSGGAVLFLYQHSKMDISIELPNLEDLYTPEEWNEFLIKCATDFCAPQVVCDAEAEPSRTNEYDMQAEPTCMQAEPSSSATGVNWAPNSIMPSTSTKTDREQILDVLANPSNYTSGDLLNVNQVRSRVAPPHDACFALLCVWNESNHIHSTCVIIYKESIWFNR